MEFLSISFAMAGNVFDKDFNSSLTIIAAQTLIRAFQRIFAEGAVQNESKLEKGSSGLPDRFFCGKGIFL